MIGECDEHFGELLGLWEKVEGGEEGGVCECNDGEALLLGEVCLAKEELELIFDEIFFLSGDLGCGDERLVGSEEKEGDVGAFGGDETGAIGA